MKYWVDIDPRPGSFLFTGSSRLLGFHPLPDALVGRMETIELWPLSQGEIDHRDERFVDEIKETESARREDFRHLKYLQRCVGDRFHRGVVLYAGTSVLSFGDRMIAAPIDSLWHS